MATQPPTAVRWKNILCRGGLFRRCLLREAIHPICEFFNAASDVLVSHLPNVFGPSATRHWSGEKTSRIIIEKGLVCVHVCGSIYYGSWFLAFPEKGFLILSHPKTATDDFFVRSEDTTKEEIFRILLGQQAGQCLQPVSQREVIHQLP